MGAFTTASAGSSSGAGCVGAACQEGGSGGHYAPEKRDGEAAANSSAAPASLVKTSSLPMTSCSPREGSPLSSRAVLPISGSCCPDLELAAFAGETKDDSLNGTLPMYEKVGAMWV